MPDLYSYIDYRKFLKDYYEEQKARDPKFSHRYFTMKVGFSSSGYFSDVLAGKKNLSGAFMLKFAKALKLGKEEEEYFLNLVLFNQAKTLEEKNRYYEKMMTTGKVKVDIVDRDKHEYFSTWQYAAVRETLHYLEFTDDYKTLGKSLNPPIAAKDAKKAIEVLAALGLIARDEAGAWRPTSGNLKMGGTFDALALSNYHKSTLELAVRALDAFPPGQRGFSTLTLPLTAEKIRKAKLAIKNLRMYLMALSENGTKADRVYQFNFQMFPVTRIEKAEGDGT
ncbi:MAG: TIGR02147 family protein [Fibrobacteres bacterium]|nr:TIGR02147 family protein [Fibrobacterota bacterium]